MENQHENKGVREEVHKEFQVERMILFSDAVFAIVITLMAIELQLPDKEGRFNDQEFLHAVFHLIPVFLAYSVGFIFIGVTWYAHLKLFAIVKSFDKGLVIRNLSLLFFVGLFPFGATVISKVGKEHSLLPFMIYFTIILSCLACQLSMQHYLLFKKPELRNNHSIQELTVEYYKKITGLVSILIVLVLYLSTDKIMADSPLNPLSSLWFICTPLFMKILGRFIKAKA
jgi:uncharacterized membrane protein